MTKFQNRQVSMYSTVLKFCLANPMLVALSPAFQKGVLALKDKVGLLQSTVKGQLNRGQGSKQRKDSARSGIALVGSTVSGLVAGWANENGNPELEARNQWTEAMLEKLAENVLPEVCSTILEDGRTVLAAGPENGITDELLTQLEAGIGLFREGKDGPRSKTTTRSTQTQTLKKLIGQTGELVKKRLDKHALFYKANHPEFYLQYKESRKLVDPATRGTKEAVNEA